MRALPADQIAFWLLLAAPWVSLPYFGWLVWRGRYLVAGVAAVLIGAACLLLATEVLQCPAAADPKRLDANPADMMFVAQASITPMLIALAGIVGIWLARWLKYLPQPKGRADG